MRGSTSLPDSTSARGALALVVVLVLVVAAAVGFAPLGGEPPEPMDRVPQQADAVTHVDVAEMTANDTRETFTIRALAVQDDHYYYRGPRLAEWIRTFEESQAVDLRDVRSMTGFLALDANDTRDPDYRAVVIQAAWTEGSMVEAVEAGANVTLHRTDADGLTVYEPVDAPSPVVGVLGPNTYALGEPAAVTDAAAVASGEADPATGSLRERFRGTRAGYVTLVYPFPHAAVPDLPEGVLRAFAHARTVTGVYYSNESANGTRLGAEFGIHTNDSDAAQTIEASLGLALPLFAANTDDPVLSQAARNVSVTQSGPSVFLGYEARMDRVRALLKRLDE